MSAGAWVQDIGGAGSSNAVTPTISFTVGTAVQAGSLIIVRAGANSSGGVTDCTVSDNGPGYIWNQAAYGNISGARTWIFYTIASNGLAIGKVIAVSFNNLSGSLEPAAASASEYFGPILPSPFDQTTFTTDTFTTAVASGTCGTLVQASELIIGAAWFNNESTAAQTLAGTNGFNSRVIAQSSYAGAYTGVGALDKIVNSTSGVSATGTFGYSVSTVVSLLATFRLASSPYPVGYPPPSRAWW